jgi:PhnB protein
MSTSTATAPERKPPANPPSKGSLVPYLQVSDANAASLFYQRAFGAQEVARMPAQDGKRLIHCHLYINDHSLMLNDAMPESGYPLQTPQAYTLTLIVDDVDAWFKRATDAGATVAMPVTTMFWGDRYAQVIDPFGVRWALNEVANG